MKSIMDKLRGVLPTFRSHEEQEADLLAAIEKSVQIEKLYKGADWPALDGLLTVFHDKAVQEMSSEGITPKQMERLNHRLELIRNFREEIDRVIYDGRIAKHHLDKLKEKENV